MSQFISSLKDGWKPREYKSGLPAHIPALDGVRGIAVLLVLMYDCLKLPSDGNPLTFVVRKMAATGWTGVDLFFVLSGFLITGILVDTRGMQGYWRSFFIRRAVRIFPLYYATLVMVFLVAPALCWLLNAEELAAQLSLVSQDQVWYWSYLQNWMIAARQAWPEERILNHFWSLAVEEQFYLVWPLVVAFLGRRSLTHLCGLLCATALGLRVYLLMNNVDGVATYVMTVTRMDSLCYGALMAIGVRNQSFYNNWVPRLPWIFAAVLLLTFGLDVVWPVAQSQVFGAYSVGHTLFGVLFALFIGWMATLPVESLLARCCAFAPLTTLGKYSYAIYVGHRFAHAVVLAFMPWDPTGSTGAWLTFGATVGVSLLFARASWWLIEERCLSWKKYAPRPAPRESAEGLSSPPLAPWGEMGTVLQAGEVGK